MVTATTFSFTSLKRIDGQPSLTEYELSIIIGSTVIFQIINMITCSIIPKEAIRVIGYKTPPLCHAIYASIVSVYILIFIDPIWIIPESYLIKIRFTEEIVCITLGYFIWDIYIVIKDSQGLAFLIHAFFCVYVYCLPIIFGCMHRPAIMCLVYEFSTVFLRFIGICHFYKLKSYENIGKMAFVISFIFARIIFGSFLSYELWQVFIFGSYDTDITGIPKSIIYSILSINILFHILNFYWMSEIIDESCKFLTNAKSKKKISDTNEINNSETAPHTVKVSG